MYISQKLVIAIRTINNCQDMFVLCVWSVCTLHIQFTRCTTVWLTQPWQQGKMHTRRPVEWFIRKVKTGGSRHVSSAVVGWVCEACGRSVVWSPAAGRDRNGIKLPWLKGPRCSRAAGELQLTVLTLLQNLQTAASGGHNRSTLGWGLYLVKMMNFIPLSLMFGWAEFWGCVKCPTTFLHNVFGLINSVELKGDL